MIENLTAPTPDEIAAWLTWVASWLPFFVFLTSVIRALLVWLEGGIIIWLPQNPNSSFWWFWVRMMQTIEYISLSLPRNSKAIREFYYWDKQQKRLSDNNSKGGNDAEPEN